MQLPEVQLKKILDGVLLGIRKDTFAHTSTESQSFLYRLLNGNILQKWNFYTQGKEIFNRASDHPRLIETRVFFDRSRAGLPTIHITLPNLQAGNDGIGIDQGYNDNFESISQGVVSITPVYTRSFQTTYHMIITSDNAFEVLTMYHVVKAGLIANMESLEYYGLRNVKFSGQDLQINEQLVPPGIFSRGIGLSLMYEADIPVFRLTPNVGDITPITGTPINLVDQKVYTINASSGSNGTISYPGTINVVGGENRTYVMTPSSGYHIASILVDSVSITITSSYTFSDIQADHTISVTFALD